MTLISVSSPTRSANVDIPPNKSIILLHTVYMFGKLSITITYSRYLGVMQDYPHSLAWLILLSKTPYAL
jgi:hypothetical protein